MIFEMSTQLAFTSVNPVIRRSNTFYNHCISKQSRRPTRHGHPVRTRITPYCIRFNLRNVNRVDYPLCIPARISKKPRKQSATDSSPQSSQVVPAPTATFWAAACTELIAALLGILLCKLTRIPVLGAKFALTPTAWLQALYIAVPFCTAFWLLDKVQTDIQKATDDRFRAFFEVRSSFDIAVFCLFVSLGEELLFRAWLFPWLVSLGLPPLAGLSLSAAIFGALHAYTKLYMVLATLAGLLFGAMFLYSGSMLQPLVVHFIYDFVTVIMLRLRWKALSKAHTNTSE